jgi:hypothetical protein
MLVDEELRVVRFYGIASPYLKRPTDHPSLHLLKIVRDEILFELSDLLGQVERTQQPISLGGIFLTDREGGPGKRITEDTSSAAFRSQVIQGYAGEPAGPFRRDAGYE